MDGRFPIICREDKTEQWDLPQEKNSIEKIGIGNPPQKNTSKNFLELAEIKLYVAEIILDFHQQGA